MENIYKKQQVSDYAHNYYSAEGNFGQRMIQKAGEYEREAEKKKAEAQNKYANYLNLVTQDRFNDLIANPDLMGNPEAIKQEMGRIRDDMASGVKDEDVKTEYLAGTDKIIGQYTERAANHQRALREREKAAQEAQAKAYQKQLNKYKQAAMANQFDFAAADLLHEFASNPVELSNNIDKLGSEIASTMKDDKEKLEFLTGVELKKNALVKAAQKNQYNAMDSIKKSTNDEIIRAATDDINLINQNIWSGNYDDADLVLLTQAQESLEDALYATNPDGTYMFTDEQRAKARASVDKSVVDGFKAYHASLPTWEREKVEDNILKSKGEIEMNGYGMTYISSASLNDMKDYIKSFRESVKKDEDYGYTPEEARQRAIERQAAKTRIDEQRNGLFEYDKKGKEVGFRKNLKMSDILDYRNTIQMADNADMLDEKDYRKYMGEIESEARKIAGSEERFKSKKDNNLEYVYNGITKALGDGKDLSEEDKLNLKQAAYNSMIEKQIDPESRPLFSRSQAEINELKQIVDDVKKSYLQEKYPALLSNKAKNISVGGVIYNVNDTEDKELEGAIQTVTAPKEIRILPNGSAIAVQRDGDRVVNTFKLKNWRQ